MKQKKSRNINRDRVSGRSAIDSTLTKNSLTDRQNTVVMWMAGVIDGVLRVVCAGRWSHSERALSQVRSWRRNSRQRWSRLWRRGRQRTGFYLVYLRYSWCCIGVINDCGTVEIRKKFRVGPSSLCSDDRLFYQLLLSFASVFRITSSLLVMSVSICRRFRSLVV